MNKQESHLLGSRKTINIKYKLTNEKCSISSLDKPYEMFHTEKLLMRI